MGFRFGKNSDAAEPSLVTIHVLSNPNVADQPIIGHSVSEEVTGEGAGQCPKSETTKSEQTK